MFNIVKSNMKLRRVLHQCQCKLSEDSGLPKKGSETDEKSVTVKKKYNPNEVAKEDFRWRTPLYQKKGDYSILRGLYSEDNNLSLLRWMQMPINLSPSEIKKWWIKEQEEKESFMQQYIPERHQILGPELAAAHFLVFRGGAVKFHEENKWIKADNRGEYQLPSRYQKGMYLQALDCSNMDLHYEGLDNIRDLNNVEWLSLNGCKYIDDFCIDVISNIFSHSLIYLDLRNCLGISERGIGALYKMRNLKILYLDDMLRDTKYELTCLLLQELNPDLDIKSDVVSFEIK